MVSSFLMSMASPASVIIALPDFPHVCTRPAESESIRGAPHLPWHFSQFWKELSEPLFNMIIYHCDVHLGVLSRECEWVEQAQGYPSAHQGNRPCSVNFSMCMWQQATNGFNAHNSSYVVRTNLGHRHVYH